MHLSWVRRRLRSDAETVIDFTGTASTDFAIAILAGLNWLTHCAHLASVPPAQQSGTIRNFRKIVTVAQQWWLTEGAAERCDQLIANRQQPPLMLYLVCQNIHGSQNRSQLPPCELSPKVGDGGNREGGISWGCLTPPLLHRRSDMPSHRITLSS
jgi:hypothetical protein